MVDYPVMYDVPIGPQTAAASRLQSISSASLTLSIFGALSGAIGSYYSALGAKNEARSRALTFDYEQSMASAAASAAERDAQSILQSGAQQRALAGLEGNMRNAQQRARTAASGTRGGVGSAAEAAASDELMRQLDLATMNTNTVRAAEEQRMRGANLASQASLAGVSARNMRGTASGISAIGAAGTSLLSNAGTVAGHWYQHTRRFG